MPDYARVPGTVFDVQYSQRNGYVNMLLPEVFKYNDAVMLKRPDLYAKYSQTLLARMLVYDTPLEQLRIDRDMLDRVQAAQLRFPDFASARFLGPWESAPVLPSGGKALRVAFYLPKAGQSCMMVVSNLGGAEVTETIQPNLPALERLHVDLRGSKVEDAMTQKPAPTAASVCRHRPAGARPYQRAFLRSPVRNGR